MPFTVRLGNPAPVNTHENDDGTFTKNPVEGEQVTEILVGHEDPIAALTEITHKDGVVGHHFAADAVPSWVQCDEVPALAQMLAARYGCPIKTADSKPEGE